MPNLSKNKNLPCGNLKLKNSLNLEDFETGTVFEVDSAVEDSLNVSDNHSHSHSSDEGELFEEEEIEVYEETLMNTLSGIPNTFAINKNDTKDSSLSDLEDDFEPFEKLARKMEDISGDEGVLKMEVQSGIGAEIPEGAQVVYHYSAFFEYADEPFDSSVLRKQPQKAYLNEMDTLNGLMIGLRSMKKKEKARFLVQPKYAFGQLGCPPRIPPNAVVLYEVTLLNWLDWSGADAFETLDAGQRHKTSFSQKLKAAKDYHKEGNDFYKSKQLTKAKTSYRKASWILENALAADEGEQEKQSELLFRMHCNLAQVNLDLKEPAKACSECRLAFEVPVKVSEELKAKLYFRYAKAKMLLTDFDVSRKYLLKAQRILPNNPEIPSLLEELLKRMMKYSEREKVLCQKMFGMTVRDPASNSGTKNDPVDYSSIDRDLQTTLKSQITNFEKNHSRGELPLPPNLTDMEVDFALRVAKGLNLSLQKHRIGSNTLWKVVRY